MPKPYIPLAAALLLAASLACKPKPSEAFLKQVKASLRSEETPGFEINMALPIESGLKKQAELRSLAEVLGNKLGFRIEASQSRKGFLPVTTYSFQDFKAPSLPGLTVQKNGSTVKMLADFQWEMVIDTALPPQEGFEAAQGEGKSSVERNKEVAEAKALGYKDAADAVDTGIVADKEKRKVNAVAFAKAVEQVRKDNGYQRAWFVTYRQKAKSTLPQDSPFWELADAWLATGGEAFSVMPNSRLLVLDQTSGWLKKRGQFEVKDTLATHLIVAFEGADGKLTKTEGWKAFLAE